MDEDRLQVTEPFLPPLSEVIPLLEGIWKRKHLTNNGPLVQQFENDTRDILGLSQSILAVANGALGLQIALKALGINGEVITSPFSYVATSSCALWEGCEIAFADIDASSLNLDPRAVEAAITPRTEAILATHVFGNPCDFDEFARIGQKHGLAVIYDAAHAFGVKHLGQSVLKFGDASMVSLHATKLMHSVEGGLVTSPDASVREKIEWMRRFGHNGPNEFHGVGINAKMSELHAAVGLCNLKYIDENIAKRLQIKSAYDEVLGRVSGVKFAFQLREEVDWNGAYYPVLAESAQRRAALEVALTKNAIFPRRYFHPPLSSVFEEQTRIHSVDITNDICERILCLPMSCEMNEASVERVGRVLASC